MREGFRDYAPGPVNKEGEVGDKDLVVGFLKRMGELSVLESCSVDEVDHLKKALVSLKNLSREKREHSLRVAERTARVLPSGTAVVGALLHDLAEKSPKGYSKIASKIPKKVDRVVGALTVKTPKGKNAPLLHLKKVLPKLGPKAQQWAIVIKLCDRLDNLTKRPLTEKGVSDEYAKKSKQLFLFLAKSL